MNKYRTNILKVLTTLMLAGTLAGTVGGCSKTTTGWTGAEVDHRSKVELVRLTHDFEVDAQSQTLSGPTQAALDTFLKTRKVSYQDELTVDLPLDPKGNATEADLARRDALARALEARNLHLGDKITPYGAEPKPGTVRLVVGRYVVTPPDCPDWRKKASPDYRNTPSSNFGCSTQSALGMMIANPRDLVEGEPLDGPDATVAATAVQKYHEGRVTNKPDDGNSTGSGMSSVSGGAQ